MELKFSSKTEAASIISKMHRLGCYELSIRPGPDCRREAFDLLALHFKSIERNWYRTSQVRIELQNKITQLESTSPSGELLLVSLGRSAREFFYHCLGEKLNGLVRELPEPNSMEEACAWGVRGLSIDVRSEKEIGWGGLSGSECYALHGLALASGDSSFSDWMTKLVFNSLRSQSILFEMEKEFTEFYWRLVCALVDNRWPDEEKISEDAVGIYAPLLKAIEDPKAFARELLVYLDHRLARSYLFPFCGAARKDRKETRYFSSGPLNGMFPFELLTLRAVAKRCLGIHLDIYVDHPLTRATTIQLCETISLSYEDEWTRRFDQICKAHFGQDWKLLEPIELLEE